MNQEADKKQLAKEVPPKDANQETVIVGTPPPKNVVPNLCSRAPVNYLPTEDLAGTIGEDFTGKPDEEVAERLVAAPEKTDDELAVKPVEATVEEPVGEAKKLSLVARLKSLSPIPRKKFSK